MHPGEPANGGPDGGGPDPASAAGRGLNRLPAPANRPGQTGTVLSVNVARVTQFTLRGQPNKTGICKVPTHGPAEIGAGGVAGDVQADTTAHGGELKAVYGYPTEDYRWWSEQLGEELEPGRFGENLTIAGLSATGALIGERWRAGTALLQVTQPREPCWKLGVRMNDADFPRRFREAQRPGAYFSVHTAGSVAAGDAVEVVHVPQHPITIALINRLNAVDRELSNLLLKLCRQDLSPAEWEEVLSSVPE
ncbi:MAG: MOSC domain-containing protein [Actinomycetota bacterium]